MANDDWLGLRNYISSLLEELTDHAIDQLFPLQLALRNQRKAARRLLQPAASYRQVSFSEAVADSSGRPLVITGDPGSGKTTLLEQWATDNLQVNELVFLLRMGLWTPDRPTVAQLAGRWLSSTIVEQVLLRQPVWVLFDALDEARGGNLDAALEEIRRFTVDYPLARVICSCRAAQLPAWAAAHFNEARVLPLHQQEVQRILEEVQAFSSEGSIRPVIQNNDLIEACRNPLILAMTMELLLIPGSPRMRLITSPSQVYDLFIDLIDQRERERRPMVDQLEISLVGGLGMRLIGYIAWRMCGGSITALGVDDCSSWLEDAFREPRWQSLLPSGSGADTARIVRYLTRRAPIKEMPEPLTGAAQITFMHATFRDIFAARHWSHLDSRDNAEADLSALVLEETQKFWIVIEINAGVEEEAGSTLRRVTDIALQTRRQEVLLLSVRCVLQRWDTLGDDIADVVIAILDAFKNWAKAFDYDLMRAGRAILNRVDESLPARLRDDLAYFADKYADSVPRLLNVADRDELLRLLEESDEQLVIDTLYSLSRGPFAGEADRKAVALEVERRLDRWNPSIVDQAIAALKDIGSPASLALLRRLIDSPSLYSPRSCAFAANAVAHIGDLGDLPRLLNLLGDTSFRYRDSVSWSLQLLARRFAESEPQVIRILIEEYFKRLEAESNDRPGNSAKGNILYSIGVLGEPGDAVRVLRQLNQEADAYVLEDGLQCLSMLKNPVATDFARQHLKDADPVVRLKAAEAVVELHPEEVDQVTQFLRRDRHRVMRHAADELLDRATKKSNSLESQYSSLVHAMERVSRRSEIRVDLRLSTEEKALLERVSSELMQHEQISTAISFVAAGAFWEARLEARTYETILEYLRSKLRAMHHKGT